MLTDSRQVYSCTRCGKAYNQSYNLSRHVNYECGKEPQFQCPYCAYKCKRRDTLKKHCVLLHKQQWNVKYSNF